MDEVRLAAEQRADNPEFASETFDLVIVDEAHRSSYGLWQGRSPTSTRTSSG